MPEVNGLMRDGFIQVHCHSEFSLRDALSKLQELIDFAKDNNLKYLSITDHGVIAAWARLFKGCRQNNIIPIFGCEVYVNNYRNLDKENLTKEQKEKYKKYFHLLVLAYNKKGIHNLIQINNDAHLNGFYSKPRTDFETLKKYNEGLIVTSACIGGEIPYLLLNNKYEQAKEVALQYKEVFSERYLLELQVNNMEEQIEANKKLIYLANDINIKTIITNDCHYIRYDDNKIHDLLIKVRDRSSSTKIDKNCEEMSWGYHARELYYKNYSEMYESWKKFHNNKFFTEDVFINSVNNIKTEILDKIKNVNFDGGIKLPKLYDNEQEIFRQKIYSGLKNRFGNDINDSIIEQTEYEYSIIRKMGYIGYFLIIEDIINYAKTNNIFCGVGRGSIAASLISYALGITEINPIECKLMFSRFLDLGRDKINIAKMI